MKLADNDRDEIKSIIKLIDQNVRITEVTRASYSKDCFLNEFFINIDKNIDNISEYKDWVKSIDTTENPTILSMILSRTLYLDHPFTTKECLRISIIANTRITDGQRYIRPFLEGVLSS